MGGWVGHCSLYVLHACYFVGEIMEETVVHFHFIGVSLGNRVEFLVEDKGRTAVFGSVFISLGKLCDHEII
jgi:hypothetical protein